MRQTEGSVCPYTYPCDIQLCVSASSGPAYSGWLPVCLSGCLCDWNLNGNLLSDCQTIARAQHGYIWLCKAVDVAA